MTNLLNVNVETAVIDELFENETMIIHSDFLLNQHDSQTETNVTQLLNAMPNELQHIAKNELGFYIIPESQLNNYLKHHVLVHNGIVEGTYDECQQYFLDELLSSYNKHFPNTFDENDEYELINHDVVNKIANYATNELLKNAKITINNEKYIIDSESESQFVNNVHNVNWVQKYVENVK